MKQVLINHSIDSRHWHRFSYRSGDVVIASWGKSGTTWVQQIVGQLLFNGDPTLILSQTSVWLDGSWPSEDAKLRFLERQNHRRFIKSHLSADFLPRSPLAKYIYVARDARDAVWSLHNHLLQLPEEVYIAINKRCGVGSEPLRRPDADVYRFWQRWMENDSWPMWPFWDHLRAWWKLRDEPNVLLLHFADLKQDMLAEIRKIAEFLEINPDPEAWQRIVKYSSFDWMKANPKHVLPLGMFLPVTKGDAFINKGTNRRWNSVLSERDNRDYITKATKELKDDECANWMLYGRLVQE